MKIADFDNIIINGRPVAPIGIVFRDTPPTPRSTRPRTLRAAMSADGGEWSAFTEALSAAFDRKPPTFDVIVNHRKRIAPRLVVRLRPRGRRVRSFLRERFDRWAETFRGCSLDVSPR